MALFCICLSLCSLSVTNWKLGHGLCGMFKTMIHLVKQMVEPATSTDALPALHDSGLAYFKLRQGYEHGRRLSLNDRLVMTRSEAQKHAITGDFLKHLKTDNPEVVAQLHDANAKVDAVNKVTLIECSFNALAEEISAKLWQRKGDSGWVRKRWSATVLFQLLTGKLDSYLCNWNVILLSAGGVTVDDAGGRATDGDIQKLRGPLTNRHAKESA